MTTTTNAAEIARHSARLEKARQLMFGATTQGEEDAALEAMRRIARRIKALKASK